MHLSSNSLSQIRWVYWVEIFVRCVYHSISIVEANWSTTDSLMNHITILSRIGNQPTIRRVPTWVDDDSNYHFFSKDVPDFTFRNLSGFEEKLDPNLKLFFKFFVRLSILISLNSTFQPSTFKQFVLMYGVYNWPLLQFWSFLLFEFFLFLVYGQKKSPWREMMMLESGRRQRGQADHGRNRCTSMTLNCSRLI